MAVPRVKRRVSANSGVKSALTVLDLNQNPARKVAYATMTGWQKCRDMERAIKRLANIKMAEISNKSF